MKLKNTIHKTPIPRFEAQLEAVKNNLAAEFTLKPGVDRHYLNLALNEAEALAFATGFPALTFPLLAEEKANVLLHWHGRQERLRWEQPSISFAE